MHHMKKYQIVLVREKSFPYDFQISGPSDAGRFLTSVVHMDNLPTEEVWVLYLNTRHMIIGSEMVSRGGIAGAGLQPRDIFKGALIANAAAIIMAHNHPSGNSKPSPDDIATTHALKKAADILGIEFLDHVVIGHDETTSFKEYGYI